MAREEVYKAVTGSFRMYGGLLKGAAEAVGTEGALALHAEQGTHLGTMVAAAIQAHLGENDLGIEAVTDILTGVTEGFGMEPVIEATPTSVELRHLKCPIYDGLTMAGWEHHEIEAACRRMNGAEVEEIARAFPGLSGELVFRASPQEPCVERFSLSADSRGGSSW